MPPKANGDDDDEHLEIAPDQYECLGDSSPKVEKAKVYALDTRWEDVRKRLKNEFSVDFLDDEWVELIMLLF